MIYGIGTVERLKSLKDIFEIQQCITSAARKSLGKMGFLEILPPIVSPSTDPGLRGAKRFEVDYYGKAYKVTGSMIMHKIISASALGKIFAFSPCLRKEIAEASFTKRHLSEFWQIDVEMCGSKEKAMSAAETVLRDVIAEVKKEKGALLERYGRELKVPSLPLKRISHEEAVDMAREMGFDVSYREEIPWGAEKMIGLEIGEPFFIVDYPRGSRGFYDKIDPSDEAKLLSFDLIYPDGYGEAVSGSEREFDYELVKMKLLEAGERIEDYEWFTKLLEDKKIEGTAGFGFGLERLTRFICGLESIFDATPFPKVPGGGGI